MSGAGRSEDVGGDLGENPERRDIDHERLNVFWIRHDIAAGDAHGRVTEGTDREITKVVADRFGVGDDGGADFQEEFANAFGIGVDGFLIEKTIGERILQRLAAKEMQPSIAFANQNGERLIDALVARQTAQFSKTRFHFREDDLLLIDDWIFELRIGRFPEAIAEIGLIERIKQKENSRRTGHVLRAGRIGRIAAGLKMFARIIIKNHRAAAFGSMLRFECVDKGFRERDGAAEAGQPLIHRAFELGFGETRLIGRARAEERFFHFIQRRVACGIGILKDDVVMIEERGGQRLDENRQVVRFAGALIADD